MGILTLEVHVIGWRSESDRAGNLAKVLIFFSLLSVMRFKNTGTSSSSKSGTLQFAERNCQIEGTALHVQGRQSGWAWGGCGAKLNILRSWEEGGEKVRCWFFPYFTPNTWKKAENVLGIIVRVLSSSVCLLNNCSLEQILKPLKGWKNLFLLSEDIALLCLTLSGWKETPWRDKFEAITLLWGSAQAWDIPRIPQRLPIISFASRGHHFLMLTPLSSLTFPSPFLSPNRIKIKPLKEHFVPLPLKAFLHLPWHSSHNWHPATSPS